MPKKIKKRSKVSREEQALLEPAAPPRLEDYVAPDDPALEFGTPEQWEDAGDEAIAVAPIPLNEEGEVDLEAERRRELEAAEQIELASHRAAAWVERNPVVLLGALVALILAPIVYVIGAGMLASSREDVSAQISPAIIASTRLVEGSPELDFFDTNEEISRPSGVFPSEQARWEAVLAASQAPLKADLGDGPMATAQLTAAAAKLRLGQFDEAITLYESARAKAPSDAIKPFITLGLATAYQGKGDTDKAVAAYDELAKEEDYAALALYQRARVLDLAGQRDQAKDAYHKLLEAHPDTSFKADVERRLAML